jgi:hypothetical protein
MKTYSKSNYAIAGLAEDDDWERVFDHLSSELYWFAMSKGTLDFIFDVIKLFSDNVVQYFEAVIYVLNRNRILWIEG